jgi:chloramphenicol-sensitive protein RarD
MTGERKSELLGTLLSFSSFLLWGVLPFYWKWLDSVPAEQILAHRILWAAVLMVAVVLGLQRRQLAVALRDGRALLVSAIAGVLVGANWFIYIWAVTSERIVEASLGYYINPLVSVLLGVLFLRERLTRLQLVALLLAVAGVVVLTLSYGRFPWVSIALAFSFGTYGLVKKTSRLNSVVSLLIELVLLAPVAAVYIALLGRSGQSAFAAGDLRTTLLLAGAGVVTVAPLLLFGAGARRIPLSRVGFLQYVAPTLMLVIGTVVYGEPFTVAHLVSFALIWTALGLYTVSVVTAGR